jgi:hypothetical protein
MVLTSFGKMEATQIYSQTPFIKILFLPFWGPFWAQFGLSFQTVETRPNICILV